jgi:hypothetical protein
LDKFFDDFNDFILSMLGLNKKGPPGKKPAGKTDRPKYEDPDMQSAWEELEDFLKGEPGNRRQESTYQQQSNRQGTRPDYETYQKEKERETLKQDYANLEVAYGAPFEEVKKAFKRQLIKYHPDKHASQPEKAKVATEITQKINASYQKIKVFEEKFSFQKKKKI